MRNLISSRLLVVDDDVGSVRLLTSVVQEFGEVFFATNGEEAVAMVRHKRPDLVLLDAEMPGMDGFAACEAIKHDPLFADLPILFVTAHSDMDIETTALGLGAVDFITKPISPPIVKARVRTHLALKQRTDELHRLAAVDGLTGIANRRSFDTALDHEWRRACRSRSPLSLLMIDVDHFKKYNDHYGHQAGDDCLRAVAGALAATPHRPGELVARYGGEEFAVILPACDQQTALKFADKLREAIADLHMPHAASDTAPEVTISLGIASLTLDCVSLGEQHPASNGPCPTVETCRDGAMSLIAAADEALYEAKRAGRNRAAVRPSAMTTASAPAEAATV